MNPNVTLRRKVTTAITDYPWVHFACHATGDLANPSAGQLMLRDHQTHPFTAADVAAMKLEAAEQPVRTAYPT